MDEAEVPVEAISSSDIDALSSPEEEATESISGLTDDDDVGGAVGCTSFDSNASKDGDGDSPVAGHGQGAFRVQRCGGHVEHVRTCGGGIDRGRDRGAYASCGRGRGLVMVDVAAGED